jgi:hypothetical protein
MFHAEKIERIFEELGSSETGCLATRLQEGLRNTEKMR